MARTRVVLVLLLAALVVATSTLAAGAQVPDRVDRGRDPADPDARLLPHPQEVDLSGPDLRMRPVGTLVAAADIDVRVLEEAERLLADLGVRRVRRADPGGRLRAAPFVLHLADEPSAATEAVLEDLGAEGTDGLPAEGYALATGEADGRATAVVAGVDVAGAFHGLQTLRQLAGTERRRSVLPTATVRDWPALPLRGVIEGFYGEPWSHEDRLSVIDFLGDLKGDSYVYAPKDDPYHLERWRDPYPPAEAAELAELVAAADAELLSFVFTVSPGQDICYSDPGDVDALLGKLDAMWDLGVRQLGVFFDDIDLELDCPADVEAFGDEASPAAAAQASLLTAVHAEMVATRPDAEPLLTVPTEYSGTGASDYKSTFAAQVPDDVIVYWTGPDVVSDTVTVDAVTAAAELWDHPLALWDNYPVNDFAPQRLFMGPVIGRDAGLAEAGLVGLSANPMNQAHASEVPLATVLDQAWNPDDYDPERSWQRAVERVGGDAAGALRTFAENAYASDIGHPPNPWLAERITAVTDAWDDGEADEEAALALLADFLDMAAVPVELRRSLDEALLAEIEPWVEKVGDYGEAGGAAVRSLLAEQEGDETAAWHQRRLMEEAAVRAAGLDVDAAGALVTDFLDWARERSELVVLTAPPAGSTAEPGDDVVLRAEVASGDVPVDEVTFLAGLTEVGVDDTAPYEVTWSDVPEGLHLLSAVATDTAGTTVRSGRVALTVGDPAPVLLVVGSADLDAGDAAVRQRIELLGHPVEVGVAAETTTADADGKAAVVVSESVSSGDVAAKFRDVAVPVAAWEHFVYDDMGMAEAPNLAFTSTDVEITAPDSPLAADLDGTVRVYQREGILGYGTPTDAADVVATIPGAPEQAAVFAYDAGDAMIGLDAPARRLGLPYVDDAPAVLTPEGQAMFDAAITWLVDGAP